MKGCEAMTVRGERCRRDVSVTIGLAGVRRRFCSSHAIPARRGIVTLWTERDPVTPAEPRHRAPWTEEDDALIADHSVPSSEAAALLGRTTAAVQIRRSLKRRERRG